MPEQEWTRISRWLHRSSVHDITWRSDMWRVTRRAHVHIEVGTSSHLELAKAMADDDADLQAQRRAGMLLPVTYLTPGHGHDIMVLEDNNAERTTSEMSELLKCQCLDRYEMVDDPNDDPNDDTVTQTKVWSGCDQTIARKRQFAPGHDAKLKSTLLKAFRAGEDVTYQDGGMLVSADPMKLAKQRGWAHFMTPAPTKKSKTKEVDLRVSEHVGGELKDDEPAGFRPARVKYRNQWRDGSIVAETLTEVTVEFDNKGTPKRMTLPLNSEKLELD